MASVGGVSSGMNGSCCSLVAPGSTAWLSVVQVSGNVSSHLHTACHYLLVLTSTWTHLTEVWRGAQVTGRVQPVKCLRYPYSLGQALPVTCSLEYMTETLPKTVQPYSAIWLWSRTDMGSNPWHLLASWLSASEKNLTEPQLFPL